jgi:mRNA-degrading endonuclease toxin of MazEF toxin-antitoxin module
LNLALPERGSVIRYAYLWAEEHRRGHEEAAKDRPAVVLALSVRRDGGQTEVLVLAVTRTPPANPSEAVALPPAIKRRLNPTCADSTVGYRQIRALAEKLALHFLKVTVRR